MTEIFLSYAREDREWVSTLAEAISSEGWGVWWDRDIPLGASFQRAIAEALAEAKCVSVVWSKAALASDWVMAEASDGRTRNILIPILKEPVAPPVPFNLLQNANFVGWTREGGNDAMATLRARYESLLGAPNELSFPEAVRLINQFAKLRRIGLMDIAGGVVSSTGVKAFRADARDSMGAVYCHSTGPYAGQVFYVRKGISIFYHSDHGGPAGALGLPVSNEELADGAGHPTSFFENGLIEWSPKTWEAQAYLFEADGQQKLGPSRKV